KDDRVLRSLQGVDTSLKVSLPAGPSWRRYVSDQYGEHEDGAPWDGSGRGRAWPVLTGERARHFFSMGLPAAELVRTLEGFAGAPPLHGGDGAGARVHVVAQAPDRAHRGRSPPSRAAAPAGRGALHVRQLEIARGDRRRRHDAGAVGGGSPMPQAAVRDGVFLYRALHDGLGGKELLAYGCMKFVSPHPPASPPTSPQG